MRPVIVIQTVKSYCDAALITVERLVELEACAHADIVVSVDAAAASIKLPSGVKKVVREGAGSWSQDMSETIQYLGNDYFLYWLDDFVPLSINFDRLLEMWNFAVEQEVNYLRLNPTPRGNGTSNSLELRVIDPGEPYRTSTILSVWNKSHLQLLLKNDETAWEFELQGSERSDAFDKYYSSDLPSVEYINLVIKGWSAPNAVKRLLEAGIELHGYKRPEMPFLVSGHLRIRSIAGVFLRFLPMKLQRKVRQFFFPPLPSKLNGKL